MRSWYSVVTPPPPTRAPPPPPPTPACRAGLRSGGQHEIQVTREL